MTTKSKSKKKPAPKKRETEMFDADVLASFRAAIANPIANPIDKRKELLAIVAGSIAAGLVTSPSPSIQTAASMATAAVDIADEILKKAGIPSVEPAAESSSPGDARVGAAS